MNNHRDTKGVINRLVVVAIHAVSDSITYFTQLTRSLLIQRLKGHLMSLAAYMLKVKKSYAILHSLVNFFVNSIFFPFDLVGLGCC